MSTGSRDPRDRATERLRVARTAWGEALTAHKMAPPDAAFAARLRALAAAAAAEREACEEAYQAGLLWRPIPGAQGAQPPYELRPGTGRRGPGELWDRFDEAVQTLNYAITGTNVMGVARAFGEFASSADALASAVDAEDQEAAAELLRREAV
jgi:hypothetical protein